MVAAVDLKLFIGIDIIDLLLPLDGRMFGVGWKGMEGV